MISVDSSEVAGLAAALSDVPARAVAAVEAVTLKAAVNVKNQLAADASGHEHFPAFPAAITFDRQFSSLTAIEYEVGPGKDRPAGALGNILYFGTSNNAPVLDFDSPWQAEEPRFLAALREAAGGSVEKAL